MSTIDTLKRLIVETLQANGEMECEPLSIEIERLYATAQMPFPFDDYEAAVTSLLLGRRIKQRESEWEGEVFYSAVSRKPKKPRRGAKKQKELFACPE